tara:strand:+ start:544 stop:771 length:228 start_codon:yes stop_codon:yes gene_type:complete
LGGTLGDEVHIAFQQEATCDEFGSCLPTPINVVADVLVSAADSGTGIVWMAVEAEWEPVSLKSHNGPSGACGLGS